MRFKRSLATFALAAASLVAAPSRGDEREVRVDSGGASLYGALEDAGGKVGPAVLLIAGSGPTDRDGNSTVPGVRPANLKLLAQALAAQGISSLRYDKKGVGKSSDAGLHEDDLRFTDRVDDAVAFGRLLAGQANVSCVVVVGHSEGALIAAMAAQRMKVCGLIEVAGPGRPLGQGLREQLQVRLPPALMQKVDGALKDLEAGRTTENIPGLESILGPSVQPYLISLLSIDPAATLKAVVAPVMILQGDRDLQVTLADARALAAARPDARLEILSGVNHVLKQAPADAAGNLATYRDPDLPLATDVVRLIVSFVRGAKL